MSRSGLDIKMDLDCTMSDSLMNAQSKRQVNKVLHVVLLE
jgi:hypothetical protein